MINTTLRKSGRAVAGLTSLAEIADARSDAGAGERNAFGNFPLPNDIYLSMPFYFDALHTFFIDLPREAA